MQGRLGDVVALVALATSWLTAGCIGSGKAACSPGETYDEGFCVCEPPRTLNEKGRCVAGEDAGTGGGEGGEGGEGAPDEGYGTACSDDSECAFDYNAHCQQSPAGDSYCTHEGCMSNADCPADSYCLTSAAPAYCKRYPTGLGDDCGSDADCSGNDAALCTVGAPGGARCAMEGCSADADCPEGTVCNDFTDIVPDAPVFCAESIL